MERASRNMRAAEAKGFRVTLDWVQQIQAVGCPNPVAAPRADRARWSLDDLEAVESADVIWLLAPEIGSGRGAFVEFGYALALAKAVVISGSQHAASIFTALGHEVATDAEGLALCWKIVNQDLRK